MGAESQTPVPKSGNAAGETKKLKPCCACPETKRARDACICYLAGRNVCSKFGLNLYSGLGGNVQHCCMMQQLSAYLHFYNVMCPELCVVCDRYTDGDRPLGLKVKCAKFHKDWNKTVDFIVEHGEENCRSYIEAHKECMRKMGFNI